MNDLKQLRLELDAPQAMIARFMRVNRSRVAAIENAKRVRPSTAARYRQAVEEILRFAKSRTEKS